jgi:hypothetical protein
MEPVIGRREAPTRWRAMTTEGMIQLRDLAARVIQETPAIIAYVQNGTQEPKTNGRVGCR